MLRCSQLSQDQSRSQRLPSAPPGVAALDLGAAADVRRDAQPHLELDATPAKFRPAAKRPDQRLNSELDTGRHCRRRSQSIIFRPEASAVLGIDAGSSLYRYLDVRSYGPRLVTHGAVTK